MRGLIILLAAIALFAGISCKQAPSAPPPPPHLDEVAPDFRLMATDLAEELQADPKAAEDKYKGKVVEATGVFFTWNLDDGQGGNRHATDITLLSSTAEGTKLFFELDRKVMDQRFLMLDYNSYITMKGRYAGRREDGSLLLRGAVLTTSFVKLDNLPARLTVTPGALENAYLHTDDSAEFRKYQGHLIQLDGVVRGIGDGGMLLLDSGDPKRPVRCDFVDDAQAKRLTAGSPVRIKGICCGFLFGIDGVNLKRCAIATE